MNIVILISNAGTGTNLKAIIDGVNSGKIKAQIVAVVSDKANAPGLKHAYDNLLPQNLGIWPRARHFARILRDVVDLRRARPQQNNEAIGQKTTQESGSARSTGGRCVSSVEICQKKEDLLPLLKKLQPDYICLAGWKQIILDEVILAFPNKILNLHPGLIPDAMDDKVSNPDDTEGLWNKGLLTDKAIQNFLDNKATYAGSSIHFLTLEFDFGPVLGRAFEKIEKDDTVETLYTRLKQKENQLYMEVLEKLTS